MADPRVLKLADLLVNYSVAVRPGDKVIIEGEIHGQPLLLAVYAEVLRAGGQPVLFPSLLEAEELLLQHGSEAQLAFIPEALTLAAETYDVRIRVLAEPNTKSLSGVDPARMVARSHALAPISRTVMRRAAEGKLRWTLTLFPTQAYAQDAEMSLAEYEDFVYGACMPDSADPVGYWKRVSAQQQRVIEWLRGKRDVHILGADTDLRLSVAGRTFINCDCHLNVPDGEIFTGPVEDSLDGCVSFSYPAIYRGHEVQGVRLWFEKGKVVKATATKNEAYLLKVLDTDAGARYVGEFAFGTNAGITRFTREILFDEKIGGSFHMALGASYPETGGRNDSAIHWDMICDLRQGGEIRVDGQTLYTNGKFVIPA